MTLGRIAVCSWSLRPEGPKQLADRCRAAGVDAVQLALGPIQERVWALERTREILDDAGIAVVSGMFSTIGEDYSTLASIARTGGLRPSEHWDANAARARECAAVARDLGLGLVTFHAGFLPEDEDDPERRVLLDRLDEVADVFAASGVRLGLETGQESAACLLSVLADLGRTDVGVNFDPANMLLYGTGDPIEALSELLPRVFQVHVKDARRTATPGTWGTEVAAGEGEVAWDRFFDLLAEHDATIDTVIEREAGERRTQDVERARELVQRHRRRNGA
ncbi:MAG: sugar phosphate isomerase/epimerase family protein [Planctomycetota bacterium]